MKTVFSSKEIFHIYNSQSQQSGRTSSNNIFFDGTKVWSYGTHYLMGQLYGNAILINSRGYSVTTAKHTSFLRRATNDRLQFEVPFPGDPMRPENIEKLESDFLDAHNKLLTARYGIQYIFDTMIESVSYFNAYCTQFKIKNRIEIPQDFLDEMTALRDVKLAIEKQNDEKRIKKRNAVKNELKMAFEKKFDADKILQNDIKLVQDSKELTTIENDEWLAQWHRFKYNLPIDSDELDLLKDYLSENHLIQLDVKNECLTYSIGPCIIINDDGSVYDQESNKWIFKTDNYESIEQRDQAIEAWMDKNGYFPSVVKADRYNNYFYYSTQGKNKYNTYAYKPNNN